MRIFISYASERHRPAEQVAHSLRQIGHRVFFDKSDLPPGASFHERLVKAIRASDLVIFLISPEFVEEGRYTRTEVAVVSQKWQRSQGRVLPVMLSETDEENVPAYIQAMTILRPEGNAVAETVNAVSAIAASRRRKVVVPLGVAALAAASLAVAWIAVRTRVARPQAAVAQNSNLVEVEGGHFPQAKPLAVVELSPLRGHLRGGTPRLVERVESGFLVASATPNQILKVADSGVVENSTSLEGEPVASSTGPKGWFVATSVPNELLRLDPLTLKVAHRVTVDFDTSKLDYHGDHPSRTPVSIAQDGEHLWLLTRSGTTGATLLYTSAKLDHLIVPRYMNDDVAFDLQDQRLVSGSTVVWGAKSGTTPSSIYRYDTLDLLVYSGHDLDVASCVTDILTSHPDLIVVDCRNRLRRISLKRQNELEIIGDLGPLPRAASSPNSWVTHRMAAIGERYVVAVNVQNTQPEPGPASFVMAEVQPNAPPRVLTRQDEANVIDIAGNTSAVWFIVETGAGVRSVQRVLLGASD